MTAHILKVAFYFKNCLWKPASAVLITLLLLVIDLISYQFSLAPQHINEITFMLMNCMLCAQMFVCVGGVSSLCCDQCWSYYF